MMDSTTSEGDMAQPKDKLVLLVEDDASALDLVKFLVTKEGFRVSEARSGGEVIKKIKEQNPDLIILDLMLPGLGGYELLRELQSEGFGDIPVVILTARTMDTQTIQMVKMEPNVKEFLQKPPKAATFGALLHTLLKTHPPTEGAPPR